MRLKTEVTYDVVVLLMLSRYAFRTFVAVVMDL